MKKISSILLILFFFVLLIIAGASSQTEQPIKKKDVPKPILDAFQKSYPKAKIIGFSKETDEGKMVYEIESTEGKVNRDIIYNPDGTVVSIEETVAFSKVPEAVRASLKKKFPKAKVTKSEMLTIGTKIQYEFVLKSGKELIEAVFEPDGKLIKKEKMEENEEKD